MKNGILGFAALLFSFSSITHSRAQMPTSFDWSRISSSVMIQTKRTNGVFICSGVLITPEIVLTAAHCLENSISSDVLIGTSYHDPNLIRLETDQKSIHIHPDYQKAHSYYFADLAMIRLTKKTHLKHYPVLASHSPAFTETLYLVGFGIRNSENIRTVTNTSIQREAEKTLFLENRLSVEGDSGGPLFRLIGKSTTELVGIHSTLISPEQTAAPSVVKYHLWIEETKKKMLQSAHADQSLFSEENEA